MDASQAGRSQLQQRLPELRRRQQQVVHGSEHGHRRAALLSVPGPGELLPIAPLPDEAMSHTQCL